MTVAMVAFRFPANDPHLVAAGALIEAANYVMTIEGGPGTFDPQGVIWVGFAMFPLDLIYSELEVLVDGVEYDYMRSGYFHIDGATRAHLSASFGDSQTVTLNGCRLTFFEADLVAVDTWSPP